MKIYNLTKRSIMLITSLLLILIVLFFIAMKYIVPSSIIMNTENYTTILKESHDKPYSYINKNIVSSGYIFRTKDFSDNQFVLARDMLVNDSESVVVGFLCEYDNIQNFENNEWIEIEGTIALSKYQNEDFPVIKIKKISRITTPNDIFVYPPN